MTHACGPPVRACNDDSECSDGNACTTETCDLALPGTITCQFTIIHRDDYGDSLQVQSAYEIVSAAAGDVRIPSAGDLEIYAVEGNTDCVAGPFAPCIIGPDSGSGAGRVQFRAEGYDPTFLDLGSSTLTSQALASYIDLCDGPGTSACNPTSANIITVLSQTPLTDGCTAGADVLCDDGNACTTESCDPATGDCEIVDVLVCDDGNACTDDYCDPATGLCLFEENVVCDDGNACSTEQCNPSTGLCEYDFIVCDDGNACTDDACDPFTGQCVSTPNVVCDDLDACTDDFCDPNTGLCTFTPNVACDDADACTDDACDPGTGLCVSFGNGTCNETPAGTDVEVEPLVVDASNQSVPDAPGVTVTYEDVQGAGTTTVVATEYPVGTTPVPSGFQISGLSGGAVIYDIDSTAALAPGSMFEICFDYSSLTIAGDPADLALLHEVDMVWEDITSSNDTVNRILCGITDSFSFFAILAPFQVIGPLDPIALGTEVSLGVDTSGEPAADTVRWSWGDGTSSDVAVTSTETVAGHTYQAPGVYVVTAELLQSATGAVIGSAEFRFVVVYDPNSGFVTGGGWFDSPADALVEDPTRTGKAQFGFVSKYKKGAQAPTGSTEFQFRAGELHFRSSAYDWLVIAGARAQFKGTGTVNGEGHFGFLLTVVDADLTPSANVDLFRIKIWDEDAGDQVIYDNGLGAADDSDPPTAIGGGSISVHKDNK